MAEIALGVAGAAIAGIPGLGVTAFTGFQVGVALGSILFPPSGPKYDRGRLDEIRIQNAQQSSPIPIIYGRNRTAGTILWASGLIERSKSSTQGGKGGGGGVTTTEYFYSTNMAVLVCEGPVTKIRRIWANDVVIYDWRSGGSPTVADWVDPAKVRVYLGNQTTPDAAIEADKGAGNVPAFKGLCYVVFEDLQLAELGNQIPNLTFEVETDWADVAEVMEDLANRVGIASSDYDFSALVGMPVRGFMIGARTEAARAMEALARANWFEIVESGGILKAVVRSGVPVLSIPRDDIGASADGEPQAYVTTTRAQEVELPREFQVTYNSEAQDFQAFNQVARRTVRWSENQESVTFPMALSDEYARYLADSLLMEAWAARNVHAFTLPYRYLRLDPGDVVSIPDEAGNTRAVRILEMNAGLLAEIEVKAVDDDPVIYIDPGLPAATPPGVATGVVTNGAADLLVFESNAVLDEYADAPFLGLVAGRGAAGWKGGEAQVDPSIRRYNSYITGVLGEFASGSTFGYTTSDANGVLGDASLSLGLLDTVNTVRVTLVSGTLSSVTYDEMVREGKNLAVIGREVIQFQTATLISGSTYQLSNLLRYRRGTDYLLAEALLTGGATHAQADPFVLVNSKTLAFPYGTVEIGSAHEFRLIENGRDYSGGLPAFAEPLTLTGASRRPYGPSRVRYTGDRNAAPGADLVFSWSRRVRRSGELQDFNDAPLDETVEAYEIDIMFDDLTGVHATRSHTGASPWTYTNAMQVADGVDGAEFQVVVYQMSQEPGVGRGHPSQPKFVGMDGDPEP